LNKVKIIFVPDPKKKKIVKLLLGNTHNFHLMWT